MLLQKQSVSRSQLEAWLRTIAVEADSVADVGGKQVPVSARVKSWKVNRYDILDLPGYDLNRPWPPSEQYDSVFCLEVFEYLYNPWQAMKNLYDIMKSGACLYVSFHFIYPHHGPRGMDCLRYTQWGVDRLLREAGFSSWKIVTRRLRRPWWLYLFYIGERMRGIDHNRGKIHQEQGYLVKAVK